MQPVALRSQYGDLFGSTMLPVLEELFRAEIEQHPSRREMLFKIVATDRDIWQSTEIHDLDLFNQIAEGQDYSFKRSKQGANKTLVVNKYGLGFSISEETIDDGKFDLASDMVRKLARSGRETQEIQAIAKFNNGFTTEVTADGLSVFNSAHTLPSGLTFRNSASTAASLSASSLEQGLQDFEQNFIGDSGIIYRISAKNLITTPKFKRLAKELIGSDLKPDTATNSTTGITNINNMNSFKEEGLSTISSPHLTSANAWFLSAMPVETGLRIVVRKPIETKAAGADVGFSSDSIYYKSRYREIIGVTHPYGLYGNAGS